MTNRKRRRVARHLNFAWIEFGSTLDGRAFAARVKKSGWKNLLRELSLRREGGKYRWVDARNPLVPIRKRGSAVMALPNTVRDVFPPTPVKDPLFQAYKKRHGNEKFFADFDRQLEFLADWVFHPGIVKKKSLTLGDDADLFADLVAISGHQADGKVYGGESDAGASLRGALSKDLSTPSSNTLKYILVPACGACGGSLEDEVLLPAFRRDNPVHGIFGYEGSYAGGKSGKVVFERFARNLGKDMTILDAWRKAQNSRHKKEWGAVMHESSINDRARDWIARKLPVPDKNGKVVRLNEDNIASGGEEVVVRPKDHAVFFVVGSTRIDASNNQDANVGLFSGEKGYLEISTTLAQFEPGDQLSVKFIYIRVGKDLVITKVLKFPNLSLPEGEVVLKPDLNQENKVKDIDGFTITFNKRTSMIKIPFEVLPDAHKNKPVEPQGRVDFGKLYIRLATDHDDPDFLAWMFNESHQRDGAYLRGPRTP